MQIRPSRARRAPGAPIALVVLATLLAGCQGLPFDNPFARDLSAVAPPPDRGADPGPYRIGVTDELELTVWQHPDVSGPLLVRRDGMVSVPLLGDVRAEGRTPRELAERIRRGLSSYISQPRVDVAVTAMRSQVASVLGGGVVRSGQVELQRNTRVVDAIAAMGGFTPFAKKRRIRILREVDGQPVEYRFDYEAFLDGVAPDSNVLLQPGDTVIVPD